MPSDSRGRLCGLNHMRIETIESSQPSQTDRGVLAPVIEFLRTGLETVAELLSPPYCAACDAPIESKDIFCARCGPCPGAPVLVPLGLTALGGAYAPPLSTAIRRFKFSHRADLARPLARLLQWPLVDARDRLEGRAR